MYSFLFLNIYLRNINKTNFKSVFESGHCCQNNLLLVYSPNLLVNICQSWTWCYKLRWCFSSPTPTMSLYSQLWDRLSRYIGWYFRWVDVGNGPQHVTPNPPVSTSVERWGPALTSLYRWQHKVKDSKKAAVPHHHHLWGSRWATEYQLYSFSVKSNHPWTVWKPPVTSGEK